MVRRIVEASIKFRLLVLSLAAGILVLGLVQLPRAPFDVFPEFSPPYVEVQTEALGLSAEEVEQLITVPLEADLLNGVQDVTVLRSDSLPGLSRIVMVFDHETTLFEARSRVQERLTQAHALPQVSKPPTMLQPLSSTSRLLMVSLDSPTLSPIQRSVLARWTIRPRLMGIPGVANVAIWGQQERQLQVQVDPVKLKQRGVTLAQVVSSAGNAQIVSPLTFLEASTPGTGGFVETAQQRLQVRHVFDKLATVAELSKIPIDGTKGKLVLGDVATVVEDHQPLIGDAIVNGKGDGLILVVEKFPHADPVAVTRAVEAALTALQPGLEGMEVNSQVFRAGNYVAASSESVRWAGLVGLLLLGLGVGLAAFSWRSAVVAAATVGVGAVASTLVVVTRGDTLNALTIAGLAVAIVVSSFDVIRAARVSPVKGAEREAFVEASAHALRNVGYGLAIGLAAIVPVAMIEGTPGAFLSPLVDAYLITLIVSLVVTLTVAPALASFLPGGKPVTSPLARVAGRESSLARLVLGPVALVIVAVLAAGSLIGSFFIPKNLVPAMRDRDVVVSISRPPGTSLPAMNSAVIPMVERIKQVAGVETTSATVGRAVTGDQITDVNSAEVWVRIAETADYDQVMTALTDAAREGGFQHQVTPYAGKRLEEIGSVHQASSVSGSTIDVLTGVSHPLTVRIYGENPEAMQAKAEEALGLLRGVPGVKDPAIKAAPMQETIQITVDLDRARKYGIKPGDVRRAEATLVQGIQVGSIFEGQKVFDVIVQGAPSTRASLESIKKLMIDAPTGGQVALDQVATIEKVTEPTVIERDSVVRTVDVVANVDGNVAAVAEAVEDKVSEMAFPLEHHAVVLTSSSGEQVNLPHVIGFGVAALIAVFLILQAAMQSWRVGAIAFASVIVGMSGGVAVALITGGSLGSWLGLLAVFGIAVRYALQLRPDPDPKQQPRQFAPDRFVDTLTVALGLALLVAPAAFLGRRAGLELLQPFAWVTLGGLVTATAVALLLPAVPQAKPSEVAAGPVR
jgi:Cu/Ag efflux pump CusA